MECQTAPSPAAAFACAEKSASGEFARLNAFIGTNLQRLSAAIQRRRNQRIVSDLPAHIQKDIGYRMDAPRVPEPVPIKLIMANHLVS